MNSDPNIPSVPSSSEPTSTKDVPPIVSLDETSLVAASPHSDSFVQAAAQPPTQAMQTHQTEQVNPIQQTNSTAQEQHAQATSLHAPNLNAMNSNHPMNSANSIHSSDSINPNHLNNATHPNNPNYSIAAPHSSKARLIGIWLALIVGASGFALSASLWQKLSSIQEQLAKQSADNTSQSMQAREVAKEAQELARDAAARVTLTETRLSEVALQRGQFEELMQSLSRSRDENLMVDLESGLRLAQQQTQLTGSIEPLLAALKTADQRIARAAQPRLSPLQRAIQRDLERIQAASITDVPALLERLDELTRLIDDLPTLNAVALTQGNRLFTVPEAQPSPAAINTQADLPPSSKNTKNQSNQQNSIFSWAFVSETWKAGRIWLADLWLTIWNETKGLIRVSRIDQPDAVLLAPEQTFFLRENLKLKLLNARLGILARQFDSARSDLSSSTQLLNKYFDPSARKTQSAANLLEQLKNQLKTLELPRPDETLTAITTAAATH